MHELVVAHYNSVLMAQSKCLRASAGLSNEHNLSVGVWSVVRTMDSSTDCRGVQRKPTFTLSDVLSPNSWKTSNGLNINWRA